jgi:hypothetical protein
MPISSKINLRMCNSEFVVLLGDDNEHDIEENDFVYTSFFKKILGKCYMSAALIRCF